LVWLNLNIAKPSERLGQQENVDALLTSFQPAEWMAATAMLDAPGAYRAQERRRMRSFFRMQREPDQP
jgi:hypothetical protein